MHWARAWNAVQRLARSREFRVTHLKYEKLISDPVGTLTELSNMLGVSDAFDHMRIVEEDPLARDIVGGAFERIDELLGGAAGAVGGLIGKTGSRFSSHPHLLVVVGALQFALWVGSTFFTSVCIAAEISSLAFDTLHS